MQKNHRTHAIIAAFSLAALSILGSTARGDSAGAPSPPSNAVLTISVSDPDPTPGSANPFASEATVSSANDSAQWIDIKDETYALRRLFIAGLRRLEARVDDQIGELTAQRAALGRTADTQTWDFAITQMGHARAYLKYVDAELNKATAGTWDQAKAKVGQAWVLTQKYYTMGKSSTTS
jgi:hypothetical protein